MKRYLISGGAGFLGTNLSLRLLREGNFIYAIDNLHTGTRRNLVELKKHKNFKFKKHDTRKPFYENIKFDYVLNLACPASPPRYYEDPILTLETNSIGTKNMLEIALRDRARFFHTSTSEVYGDPLVHPQKENYFGNVESYSKRSCYDEGKRYAEALIWQYRNLFGVNTAIIRIFNTYGPWMDHDDGRVVTNFIKQALFDTDITVQGTGKHTRSFCYVDDQVEGMMRMIHSREEGPINIGNPDEFTVIELAKKVIELTGSKSKIIHVEEAISDPKKRKPNIALAKKKLGWSPKVKLDEGLKRTLEWTKENF
jgi:UDP-glucuronate decarboxylase